MEAIRFDGKLALVTGGASGIGKATALAFAKYGANVIILDIDEERGSVIANEHPNIDFCKADISLPQDLQNSATFITLRYGRPVDILVSNAGVEDNAAGNLLFMPEPGLRRIIDVNLFGAIYCARAFMPNMCNGGKVIFVSSLQAFMACLPGTSYQASKAGLLGVTKALAIEVAHLGINVNAVCPSGVATEGMGAVRGGDSGLDGYRRHNPVGRRAWPDEIAYPILFLCSPWASYMTGQVVQIDGGMSALGMPYPGEIRAVLHDPDVLNSLD